MRSIIPTHWHAFLDYIMAFTLLGGPWVFTFHESFDATIVSLWSGAAIVILSVFTRYEGGLMRKIPLEFHLNIDIVLGLFLIISPFLFDFSEGGYSFHIVIGVILLGAGIFTKSQLRKRMPPVEISYDTERDN